MTLYNNIEALKEELETGEITRATLMQVISQSTLPGPLKLAAQMYVRQMTDEQFSESAELGKQVAVIFSEEGIDGVYMFLEDRGMDENILSLFRMWIGSAKAQPGENGSKRNI